MKEQSKELEKYGGYFQRLGSAFLLSEVGKSSVYCSCLKNMPEGQTCIPEILRCVCTETKIDTLVVCKKNSSILQNLVKMVVESFEMLSENRGNIPTLVLCPVLRSLTPSPFQLGPAGCLPGGCAGDRWLHGPQHVHPASPACPSLVMPCAEADSPVGQLRLQYKSLACVKNAGNSLCSLCGIISSKSFRNIYQLYS